MDAFFTAAASIREGDGVMVNEYQSFSGFKVWRSQACQKLETDFRREFWVVKTRNNIIHIIGNIGYQTRRIVRAQLVFEKNEYGGWDAYRADPAPDNRWHFARDFDEKEGGKVIVDRCGEYLAALTQMVSDWENKLRTTSAR